MEKIILEPNSRAFIDLASGGNYSAALLKLRNEISMQQSLYACDELSAEAINGLIQNCMPGVDERNRLVLELCRDLVMPQKPISGGAGLDLDEARRFLLEKLNPGQAKRRNPKMPYPGAAVKNCFYPEFLTVTSRRDRIAYIAETHKNLGPHYPRQASFFSLGGTFNWSVAMQETNPSGTTCGKFVRACLFASGCRAINNWHATNSTIFNYIGLGKLGQNHPAFVRFDPNKMPKKGDVFWIQSGTMMYKGKKADDSHVGMIVNVLGPKTWETIEGGQKGNTTVRYVRNIVMDGKKAAFRHGGRQIQGWVDVERFAWEF